MEIITTYGDTVYNDGTIKKQMVYQFTDTTTMVSMWNQRDTSTNVEWTMSLDNLTIICVDYVKYGVDVHRYPEVDREKIDLAWLNSRIIKYDELQKQYRLIEDEELKIVVRHQLDKMLETMSDTSDTFDRTRLAAILCIRDLNLSGEEEE